MLEVSILLLSFSICKGLPSSGFTARAIDSCQIGDVVKNKCNECVCTPDRYFECKPIDCNKNRAYKEAAMEQSCTPNRLYSQNLINCICNKNGTWPHENCQQTFLSLPEKSNKKSKCEPNSYVKIDCNVCKCGADGEIIPNRCTKNTCENESSRRSDVRKKSNVYSKCILKNWYSLAPCQFCYCANENKLVCNTGHNYAKKLEAGQYNLEICGTEMIKEAMELVPEDSKELREGIDGSKQETTTIQNLPDEKTNVALNKNKQQGKYKASDEESDDDSDDSSDSDDDQDSNSKESKKSGHSKNNVRVGAAGLKSKAQFDDNDDTGSSNDDDDDASKGDYTRIGAKDDKSNEMTVDLNQAVQSKPNVSIQNLPGKKQLSEDLEFTDNTLKINVPSVLHKMFEMALRKSMVAISNTKKCTPGSTYMAKCNMCFCLKNGKELCTANKC